MLVLLKPACCWAVLLQALSERGFDLPVIIRVTSESKKSRKRRGKGSRGGGQAADAGETMPAAAALALAPGSKSNSVSSTVMTASGTLPHAVSARSGEAGRCRRCSLLMRPELVLLGDKSPPSLPVSQTMQHLPTSRAVGGRCAASRQGLCRDETRMWLPGPWPDCA